MAEPCTFGACLTSVELPAIIAGTANLNTCQKGKFQGIIPNTTPKDSYDTKLVTALDLRCLSLKNSSELCDVILNETGVAMLPGSEFGFKPGKMLTRLSYTDFNGSIFLENTTLNENILDEKIEKYAPNVAEGAQKLSNWAKNL